MENDADTPASGSPLSDIDSDEFQEDVKFNHRSRSHSRESTLSASEDDTTSAMSTTAAAHEMPPAKRRKTGTSSYDHATPQSASTLVPPRSPTGSISSDSSGSMPNSPSFANLGPTHPLSTAYAAAQANPADPDSADYTQVTRCLWDACTEPEQGNMDNLVQHINDVHIVARQKKYYCEWEGCTRKGQPHTSAYALKAHMRSHTKEKPFMCQLPECDRSFTRSDALAKHMRTVHETEALRPSDPVPRGHTGGISNGASSNMPIKRLKLTMGGKTNGDKRSSIIGDLPPLPTRHTTSAQGVRDIVTADDDGQEELFDAIDADSVPFILPIPANYYPPEIWADMDEYERNLPPSQYFRLLRRQVHWAEQECEELQKELGDLRATTEDANGNLMKRGSGDEKSADENRKLEYQRNEQLQEALMRAEAGMVLELTGEGSRDQIAKSSQDPWELLRLMQLPLQ
jgi:hypothetical protein